MKNQKNNRKKDNYKGLNEKENHNSLLKKEGLSEKENHNSLLKKEGLSEKENQKEKHISKASHTTKKNGLMVVMDILHGPLTEKQYRFFLYYFLLISILEIMAYTMQGVFSFTASRIWMIGGSITFCSIFIYFIHTLKQDLIDKKYFSLAAILLLVLYLLLIIGNVNLTEINPDAAQQAAAGLESFHSSDFNYTEKAFLGYPNRQYILSALPALLFGRRIATLQLGFAMPFIAGIMLLYVALRKWAQKMTMDTNIAVLPIYALFVFPFITEYYINFEQAIFPISFTMIAVGFFLIMLCKPNALNIFGLAWILCLCCNSYTPVLASLGLMVVFIAIICAMWLRKKDSVPFSVPSQVLAAKSLLLVEMNIIAFFIATLLDSRQDRITETRTIPNPLLYSFKSIYDFLLDRNAVFLGMFGVIVIIYILAGLSLRLKKRDFLISLWVLGVFAASNLLTGYTSYQPAWIMQRALIVIPVIIVAITLICYEKLQQYKIKIKQEMLLIITLAFVLIGYNNFMKINQSFTYFNHIQPMKYVLKDLENAVEGSGMDNMAEFNFILYTDNVLIKNPGDYCKFFYPNANIYTPEHGNLPGEIDLGLPTFAYAEQEFSDDSPLKEYEILTFQNRRHNMDIIWYRSITH